MVVSKRCFTQLMKEILDVLTWMKFISDAKQIQ
jgi:hypothetical protein